MNALSFSTRSPDHPVDPVFVERWSPRAFGDAPISESELLGLLEAARWAPSAANVQPWRFVVALRGEPAFDRIVETLSGNNRLWAGNAAALVIFASVTTAVWPGASEPAPNGLHAFDTGAAWASFAIQARKEGWHTHGMAGFDREALAATIRLPADHAINAVVAIGELGDPATLPEALRAREVPSQRRPLSETVLRGSF
ncbi:nitroreductase family protein [Tabrizicola sp. J26]|uniref:nitroreductase family protein n=1 Tax=Alitabrizicola rongguiensis TaxID=2909234 RepID=UPI001F3843CC|nr:nitroreductase family protein [Tabrizicola rongguiensis]MCF1707310.1 nitroreductase family protein [Tabrizicola rongguiensis]